jgi:hypothetical protein
MEVWEMSEWCVTRPGDSAQREARAVELCAGGEIEGGDAVGDVMVVANEGAPRGMRFVVRFVESTSPPRIFIKSEWSEGGVAFTWGVVNSS